jgi:hypothetical protein
MWNAATGSSQIGGVATNVSTAVSSGLMTVTLDFNSGMLDGSDHHLEIGARMNGTNLVLSWYGATYHLQGATSLTPTVV